MTPDSYFLLGIAITVLGVLFITFSSIIYFFRKKALEKQMLIEYGENVK